MCVCVRVCVCVCVCVYNSRVYVGVFYTAIESYFKSSLGHVTSLCRRTLLPLRYRDNLLEAFVYNVLSAFEV